jgi:hypothetical protein
MVRRLLAGLVCIRALLHAQTSIRPAPAQQQWFLTAGSFTYVIGIDDGRTPQTLYSGPKLPEDQTMLPARMAPERASFDGP